MQIKQLYDTHFYAFAKHTENMIITQIYTYEYEL